MQLGQLEDNYDCSKIYIAGPISGCENLNRDEFNRVEKILAESGHFPINPFKLTEGDKYLELLSLDLSKCETERGKEMINKEIWQYCMRICIKNLVYCSLVVVLKNWETSKGAIIEILIAQKLNIPVIFADTFEPINYSFDIIKNKNG